MNVHVKFYSYYRLIAGMESTAIQLPENATIQDLINELKKQIRDLDDKLPQTHILVNQIQATEKTLLNDNDLISMLYIIGGG